ncbi:MAG: hypothetical protein K6A23_08835 [Butyrivibrio sp.]|nr:hypothetical protein [Butyrivibrio sp.]
MLSEDYLHELLRRYQNNFDITKDYKIGNKTYPAYAWFFSLGEKYVLKKEAQLWAIRAYEHVLFMKVDEITTELLKEIKTTIEDYVEPQLVRKGEKYPEKDHMCSYMTFVIISEKTPDSLMQKAIKKFHYDKGYLFNFRGHSEGRIACACIDSRKVLTNYSGKELKELLTNIFNSQVGNKEEKVL